MVAGIVIGLAIGIPVGAVALLAWQYWGVVMEICEWVRGGG